VRDVGCLFCAVVVGDEPARVVLETDDVVGFLDNRPVCKGHTLLVTRRHVDTLIELSDDVLFSVFHAVRRVAGAVRGGLGAQGSFVAMNNVVSQSVQHVHVVPRTKGDGLPGFFWPRTTYKTRTEAESYAALIRETLANRKSW